MTRTTPVHIPRVQPSGSVVRYDRPGLYVTRDIELVLCSRRFRSTSVPPCSREYTVSVWGPALHPSSHASAGQRGRVRGALPPLAAPQSVDHTPRTTQNGRYSWRNGPLLRDSNSYLVACKISPPCRDKRCLFVPCNRSKYGQCTGDTHVPPCCFCCFIRQLFLV